MMRTEDDLRAAFRALERHTPDVPGVLRHVYGRPRRPGRLARGPGRRRLRAGLILAAVVVTAVSITVAVARGPATSTRPAAGPSLRARLLAAIQTARGDILATQVQLSGPGEAGPGSGTGHGQTLTYPWYPRPGQQVKVHTLSWGSDGKLGKDFEYVFTMPAGSAGTSSNPIDSSVWGGADLNVAGAFIAVFPATHTWGEWRHLALTVGLSADAAGIRRAISQGRLTVIGHAVLGGRPVIELGVTVPPGRGAPVQVSTAELWVDAATYLPVRQVLVFSDGKRDQADYTFLPPTAANLATLRPVIPAGYHRTSLLPGQRPPK
ncbi:MAG: hypothetical protein ACLPKI_03960 [Streptosporangiaceae bacterium]